MFIDLTLGITQEMISNAQENEKFAVNGHLGTHLDIMKKKFPLEYIERRAIAFDVSQILGREIDVVDVDFDKIKENMCVVFYTGYIEKVGYGTKLYFQEHPQLSRVLIDKLLEYKISLLAIDCAGVRRHGEHRITDQLCADNNVFIIENVCNIKALLSNDRSREFIANTYPLNYLDATGLPCRIIAKI
jgi:kynurenine formamidase